MLGIYKASQRFNKGMYDCFNELSPTVATSNNTRTVGFGPHVQSETELTWTTRSSGRFCDSSNRVDQPG